jgi:hypothetical protein
VPLRQPAIVNEGLQCNRAGRVVQLFRASGPINQNQLNDAFGEINASELLIPVALILPALIPAYLDPEAPISGPVIPVSLIPDFPISAPVMPV